MNLQDVGHQLYEILEHQNGESQKGKSSQGFRQAFVIASQASETSCPGKTTLYDPASGQQHRFSMDELLTGRELCELLDISYEDIVAARACDQSENLSYFVNELIKIPSIEAGIGIRGVAQKNP